MLNAPTFPFVIDLACLASRREYLKLDKWLGDKIREHGVRIIYLNDSEFDDDDHFVDCEITFIV